MLNVIVTGAAGFLGISLTRALVERGYNVYAIVRPLSPHNLRLKDIPNVSVIELQMDQISCLLEKLSNVSGTFDTFYHLAWHGGRYDIDAQKENVDEAVECIKIASKLKCRRWIGTGSQAEYGARTDVVTEETTPHPYCAYGSAKVAACYLTRYYAETLGIEWIWGRIYSLYGENEPAGRMLPDLVNSLRSGKSISLSSCEQYWNYLDVRDAASYLLALGEQGCSGEIYNIAHPVSRPLKEYVEIIHHMYGSDVEIIYGLTPKPFVSLRPSTEKLFGDIGVRNQISFEEGLRFCYGDNMI